MRGLCSWGLGAALVFVRRLVELAPCPGLAVAAHFHGDRSAVFAVDAGAGGELRVGFKFIEWLVSREIIACFERVRWIGELVVLWRLEFVAFVVLAVAHGFLHGWWMD